MTTSPRIARVRHLFQSACPRNETELTDEQLLTNFVERRDEAAFADLVFRHGPMVWRVCRHALTNQHDAEDAFQATFLVLVRKSASVRPREMLANWLHGVASTTAHRARATAAKRGARERQVTPMPERPVPPANPRADLHAVIDLELSRLPEKYRVLILLCDLEDRSRKEVAHQLGLPEGTVAGRLARARVLLARRLTRQGITLSGGLLAALLAEKAVGNVPPGVLTSTITTAARFAAESAAAGVVCPQVATLAEGVMKTIWHAKLKATATLAVVLIGVCMTLFASGALSQPPVTAPQAVNGGDETRANGKLPRAPEPAPKRDESDAAKILGTWWVVKSDPKPFRWTFSADAQRPYLEQWHPGGQSLHNYELTPEKHEIRFPVPTPAQTPVGRYVLDGDVLVLTLSNYNLPAELITAKGADGTVVLVLKRETKLSDKDFLRQHFTEPDAKGVSDRTFLERYFGTRPNTP